MIVRSCLPQRTAQSCLRSHILLQSTARRQFHKSCSRRDDGMPNHYATLELSTSASPAEIKKQFYKLSKAHHPDLHPDDPNAAQRFVKISEAHATLGSAEKKTRYDRDFLRAQAPSGASGSAPGGSYSSAAHAGSRPASGLSRRRTQFRGPPPSFYRSGGWGQHHEKRSEAASKASHSHEAQGQAQSGAAGPAGTGPGGFTTGFNDVHHFDQQGHLKTHDTIERTRHRTRRRRGDDLDYAAGGSYLFNFVMISGVLAIIFGVTGLLVQDTPARRKQKDDVL